jgi:hypothetical protein
MVGALVLIPALSHFLLGKLKTAGAACSDDPAVKEITQCGCGTDKGLHAAK